MFRRTDTYFTAMSTHLPLQDPTTRGRRRKYEEMMSQSLYDDFHQAIVPTSAMHTSKKPKLMTVPHGQPSESTMSSPPTTTIPDYSNVLFSPEEEASIRRQPGRRRNYEERMDLPSSISMMPMSRQGASVASTGSPNSSRSTMMSDNEERDVMLASAMKRLKTSDAQTPIPSVDVRSLQDAREIIAELMHERAMREKRMKDLNRVVSELNSINSTLRQQNMQLNETLRQTQVESANKDIRIRQLQTERSRCQDQLRRMSESIQALVVSKQSPYSYA